MNTKKQFRIALYKGADNLCNSLAVLAAKFNGGEDITLLELQAIVNAEKRLYPVMHGDMVAEIIGENLLHIDRKMPSGEWETVCTIELVEVMELATGEDDIPVGMFQAPGINGYNPD